MFPTAKKVRHVKGYDVEVTFSNGEKHVVPLREEVLNHSGPVIDPLKDVKFFARVFVNPEGGHLEWPNGYDICPDVLYWLATGKPIKFASEARYHRPPPHLQKNAPPRRKAPRSKQGATMTTTRSRRR